MLRGDSTLRAHLLAEYRGLRDAAFEGRDTALMLVPALPAAGRVTVCGRPLLERDGDRTRRSKRPSTRATGGFSYRAARLVDWAQERSGGFFAAADGVELTSTAAGGRRAEAVAVALRPAATGGRPAVFVPDAESSATSR